MSFSSITSNENYIDYGLLLSATAMKAMAPEKPLTVFAGLTPCGHALRGVQEAGRGGQILSARSVSMGNAQSFSINLQPNSLKGLQLVAIGNTSPNRFTDAQLGCDFNNALNKLKNNKGAWEFYNLVNCAATRFTKDQFDLAFDATLGLHEKGHDRGLVTNLISRAPERLSDDQFARAFNVAIDRLEKSGEKLLLESLFDNSKEYNSWSGSLVYSYVFHNGEFDGNRFNNLPFTNRDQLAEGYLNSLPAHDLVKINSLLFSILPDNILENLSAHVLNGVQNSKNFSLRLFSKLSDETLRDLNKSVFTDNSMAMMIANDPHRLKAMMLTDVGQKRLERIAYMCK